MLTDIVSSVRPLALMPLPIAFTTPPAIGPSQAWSQHAATKKAPLIAALSSDWLPGIGCQEFIATAP